MTSLKMLMMAMLTIFSISVFAQEKTETFKVYGNCGMCKNRIEKAAKTEAVTSAVWNVDTKIMTVTYDAAKITNEQIQKKIIAVGHDTEKFKADDKVYEKLPGCCLYERKSTPSQNHSNHKH